MRYSLAIAAVLAFIATASVAQTQVPHREDGLL
jgi:hypothetical protein